MKKGYRTKNVIQSEPMVPSKLPPNIGKWEGWDWNTFYLAILTILEKPSDLVRYQRALEAIQNLPQQMIFTTSVVASAWARFVRCYPDRDNASAYRYMTHFLSMTNRLVNDSADWAEVENEWEDLESGNGQVQKVFQNTAPQLSAITYQVRGLYFLQVIPEEYKHPGTGRQVGNKFIPEMIPKVLNYIGAYESDMALANSMTEYAVGSLIDTQWDYYSKTTNATLKMYHLANLNGYYQLYIRITSQIPWNYGLITASAISEVKTGYTFTVTVPESKTQFPVLIDGVYVGAAPVKISIGQGFLPEMITPGQHIVEVRTAAYQPYKETVMIPADTNSTLTVSPTYIPLEQRVSSYYKLNVSSVPIGAAIIIDNKDTGLITNSWLRVDDTHIKPGSHLIRIYKEGYIAFNGSINVNSDKNTDLSFVLGKVPEPLPDPLTVITPIVIIVANKYKITPGANVVIIHPNTFDAIISESASMAAQGQTRTDVNWNDMAYNALVMKNIVRGYIPSLQEIYNTTDGFTLQNLKGRGVPIGQGFDTLDGSLYDEIIAQTAKQTAAELVKKTGLTLSVNAMAFLTNDAKESMTFFGFKRGKK